MRERTFSLDYVAPIPVGHRVEITVLQRLEPALFGDDKVKDAPNHPLVKDLDTGVEYGAHWHYMDPMGIRFSAGNEYPLEQRSELPKEETVVGKVLVCRVLSERISSSWQVQTTLRVEID